MAQDIWDLQAIPGIFDKSIGKDNYNIFSITSDDIVYEISQKEIRELTRNFTVDILVKKIEDLEYRPLIEGQVRHITRAEESRDDLVFAIRNLIKIKQRQEIE